MADQQLGNLQAGKLFSVEGLIAVVTGGGSGLGSFAARALALNGASKVFIIGRREESLRKVAESLPNFEGTIIPVIGDVSSKESLASAYQTISQQVSHIDILLANSGINGPAVPTNDAKTQKALPIDQLCANILKPETKDIADVFTVNVIGVQYTIATFLPLLDAANKKRPHPPTAENFTPRPQIITVSSIGGYNRKPLGNISYGPSKAAVIHLTKQLSTLFVDYDIRVNSIAPGVYLSEMTQGFLDKMGGDDPYSAKSHNVEGTYPKAFVPATRTGDEEDLAGAILYLCSRAGAYINGNILVTDGGRLSVMPASY